jgi:hypothetical protein
MKLISTALVGWLLLAVPCAAKAQEQPRVLELKSSDGTLLKATYFAAAKPGPGVLLLHQGNRTRKSWDDLAGQLVMAGINTRSCAPLSLPMCIPGFRSEGNIHRASLSFALPESACFPM